MSATAILRQPSRWNSQKIRSVFNMVDSDRLYRSYTMVGEDRPHGVDVKRQEENVQNDPNNNPEIMMEKLYDKTRNLNDAVSAPPHESCD